MDTVLLDLAREKPLFPAKIRIEGMGYDSQSVIIELPFREEVDHLVSDYFLAARRLMEKTDPSFSVDTCFTCYPAGWPEGIVVYFRDLIAGTKRLVITRNDEEVFDSQETFGVGPHIIVGEYTDPVTGELANTPPIHCADLDTAETLAYHLNNLGHYDRVTMSGPDGFTVMYDNTKQEG